MQIQIKDAVEKGLGEIKCPFCGKNEWIMNRNVTAQFPIDQNNSHCNGNVVPTIEMTCTECGYVASFNMDVLCTKVMEKENKQE